MGLQGGLDETHTAGCGAHLDQISYGVQISCSFLTVRKPFGGTTTIARPWKVRRVCQAFEEQRTFQACLHLLAAVEPLKYPSITCLFSSLDSWCKGTSETPKHKVSFDWFFHTWHYKVYDDGREDQQTTHHLSFAHHAILYSSLLSSYLKVILGWSLLDISFFFGLFKELTKSLFFPVLMNC